MNKNKNFFDEIDGGWEDVIADVYEKSNFEYYTPSTINYGNHTITKPYIAENDIINKSGRPIFPRLGKGIIKIPSGVNTISHNAFINCDSIKNIEFPKSLLCVDNNAFSNCNGLKKLKFNEGLSIIGPNSFFKCSNIISIYLPPTLTSINYNAFNYCGLTGDLKIPSSVKNIDENAFHENKNLNGKLFLSEGLLEIGRNCFENCSFTGELKIPETVEYIGKEAFSGCNFSKIYVPKNNVNKWVIGWNNGLNCEIIEY